MSQQSEYMTGYNNGWADALRDKKERTKAAHTNPGCLCCGEQRESAAYHAATGRYVCVNCIVPAAK